MAHNPLVGHHRVFTIMLRHTALGRIPMEEWSARRRDLYLTTQITHKRQISTPQRYPNPPDYTTALRHITLCRTPLEEWSARRRDLYLTTHITHKRQISTPRGIRIRNNSRWADSGPRLRPRGHWDRQLCIYRIMSIRLVFSLSI
jgi:hypothetical protein